MLKVVHTSTTPHTFQDIPIHEGSLFLLPANVPHCPVRYKDTIGIVMEQPRLKDAVDEMRWYCQQCEELVWQKRFICRDLGTQIKQTIQEFDADDDKKTCRKCGTLASITYATGQVVQPPRLPE